MYNGSLYAGTDNWNQTTRTSAGGGVWRTSDGSNWTQVNSGGFGDTSNITISGFASFGGYLYASTGRPSGTGGAQVWRCKACDNSDWVKVVDNGFGNTNANDINALQVFNAQLYFVVGNQATGLEVWRSNTGNAGTWSQVGYGGFGNSNNYVPNWNNSVAVYNNNLFIAGFTRAPGGQVWEALNSLYLPLVRR